MDVDLDDYDTFYKIIVIGDAGVGKTNLVYTFDKGRKPLSINPTVGVQFTSKTITLHDGRKAKTQIWDTAGQQQFKAVTMSHYKGAVGALIIFDITNRSSFDHVKQWFGAVRDRSDVSVQVGLIGHKSDSSKRQISKKEAQKLAQNLNVFYMQSSITEPESIKNIFDKLLTKVVDVRKKQAKGSNIKLDQKEQDNNQCKC